MPTIDNLDFSPSSISIMKDEGRHGLVLEVGGADRPQDSAVDQMDPLERPTWNAVAGGLKQTPIQFPTGALRTGPELNHPAHIEQSAAQFYQAPGQLA